MKQLFNILVLFLLILFSNNIMSQSYSLYCVDDYFVNATECDLCDEYGSGRQFFNGLVLDARAAGKDILVRSPYDILVRGNTIILRDWTMNKVTINMSNIKNFSTPFSLLSYLKDCSGGTQQGGGGLTDGDYGDMTISGDGKIITLKNDIVGSDELQNTTVAAGTYNVANITVDAQGRITSASAATADLLPLATPLSGNNNVEAALVYLDNKPAADGSETKINAGTNVSSITGSGTIADPYVINVSSGTATVGDGDYGDVVVSSGVWTVTGGGSTQVADITALAASSFPVGTLVTVQSNGAVYKIESSNTSPFTTSTNLVIQDANSNFAIYQPTQNGYDLKQLGLVSDWDFDGNTGTDNGSTFNSLIEEITTKGYTAYIPEGNYGISTSSGFIESDRLEFADGGAIIGAGSNLTKLYVPHYENFMFIGKSDDFTLKGFKIRPRETAGSGSLYAFKVQETNNLTIDDVFVEDMNFIDVSSNKTYSILPSKNIRILNSKSLNAVGNAFIISRAEGIEIAYTTIDNADRDLIKFSDYSFNIHIHNCKLLNGSDDYIDFFSGGTNAIIENNLFRGGGHTEAKAHALGNCADNITYRNNTFDNVGINLDEASYRPLGNSRMLSASDGATITHNFNLPSFEFSNIELRAFDTNGDLVTSGFSTSSESANSFVFTNAANNVTHLLVSLPPSTHYAAVSRTEQIPSGSSTYTIERTGSEDFNFTLPQILLYEKSTRASVTNVSVSSEYTLSGDSLTFTFPSPTVTDYIMVVQIGMDGIDNLIIENNDFINMEEKAFASNGAISGRFSNNTINIIGDVVGITVPQVKGSFDIIGNSFIYQLGIDYSSTSYAITDNTYGLTDSYFYGRLTIKNNYAENAPRFLNLDPTTNGGMYAENEWIIESNTMVNPEDGVSVQGLGEQIDQELVPSYQIRPNSLSYYRYSGNKIKFGSITQGTTTGSVQDQCLISVIIGADAFALGEVVGKDGSGNWVKADNTTSIEAIGYVIRKFGSRMLVQTCGIVDDPDAGFTLGDVYYTGTNGATTTTKPANVQKIGTVISTSRLLLNIDATYSSSGGGGSSTQVADLTALAASTFSIGTLVTVQNTGATYKIESSVPATWNSGTVDGTVALNDANSNVAFLQTINEGNLYLASHLGFDPTGVVDGGAKARTLMPLLSEYEHGIYWDDGATFLLKTRDKAGINGNPENANILSIDYDNFLWVGSGNEDTQAILDFRVADDIDNMNYADIVGLYFNMVNESINNFTIDGVHIRGDQRLVHNDNTDLFVRTITYMLFFKSPIGANAQERGEGWRFKNNKFSKFHSFASVNQNAFIKDIKIINNEWDDWGYGFGMTQVNERIQSESVTLDMPINTYTFSEIAENVHIRFHDGEGTNYGIINYNILRNLTDTELYGEITDWNNTETVTWDISNATTDYTDATKVTVTISWIEDLTDIDDVRLHQSHPSSCIELPPSRDVKILNNRFYDMGNTGGDHIIYQYRSCENLVISGNTIYNFDDTRMKNGGGFHIRGGAYKNVVISNNIIHNDGAAIFSLGAIDNIEIYDNVIINDFYCNNFSTAEVFMFVGTRNVKATNNIFRSVIEKRAITFSELGDIRTNENIYLHDNYFENVQSVFFTESMNNIELQSNTYVATMGQDFGYDLLIESGSNTNVSLRLLNEQFVLKDAVNHATNSIFAGFNGLTIRNPSFIDVKQSLTLGNSSHALTNSKTQGLNEYSFVSVSSNSNVLNLDSYTATDNTPQTLSLSRSLSMNDLSVFGEAVINRAVNVDGAANTLNNNSTVYNNSTVFKTNAFTNRNFTNTNELLTIDAGQGFDLTGQIINYKSVFNDRSAVSTTNTTAAAYTYKKDRTSGTASNGVALSATVNAQNGTITNAKALDINVTEASGTNTNAIGIQINDVQGTTEYAIKQDGADDLNQFAGQVTIQNVLNLVPIIGANAPASPSEGDVIIVSDAITSPFDAAGMYLYLGGAWAKL